MFIAQSYRYKGIAMHVTVDSHNVHSGCQYIEGLT